MLGPLCFSIGVSVMDILRKSGNKPALEGHDLPDEWTGFMNMRQLHRGDRGLTEKLLSDQASQAEYRRGIDSLIQGLVGLLPKRDGIWPLQERAKWLRLAAGIFDLGYKPGDDEHGEINIVVVKQEAAGSGRS
jgi:hypothetical protein